MGLLSDLVKNVFEQQITDKAKKVASNLDKNFVKEEKYYDLESKDKIPLEYSMFPVLEATIGNLTTKKTDNYKRCTMTYYNLPDNVINNYKEKIVSEGYSKASNVRYEKDRTYIIVDDTGTNLVLVYHIKF